MLVRFRGLNAVVALTASLVGAVALGKAPPVATSKAVEHETRAANHASALKTLRQMSDTLAQARSERFKVQTLKPIKAANGQSILLIGASEIEKDGTHKLYVKTGGDLFPHELFYDGGQLTIFAPTTNVFAQKKTGPTVDAMITQARQRGVDQLRR